MPAVTHVAEGFAGRVFTVDEVLLMQKKGIIAPDENFELIEGEIVPMGPKYVRHERVKSFLGMALARFCPPDLLVGYETSVRLSDCTIVEPDLCLYRRSVSSLLVEAPDLLLVVEVAVSSASLDRGVKAALYAKAGVPELWILDVDVERIIVQTEPGPDGSWRTLVERTWADALTHVTMPGLAVRMRDLCAFRSRAPLAAMMPIVRMSPAERATPPQGAGHSRAGGSGRRAGPAPPRESRFPAGIPPRRPRRAEPARPPEG
jgi:Uma2 family endonuclease